MVLGICQEEAGAQSAGGDGLEQQRHSAAKGALILLAISVGLQAPRVSLSLISASACCKGQVGEGA